MITRNIAGAGFQFSGVSLDLSGATLEIADPENLSTNFVFATSDTVITGKPSFADNKWRVRKSADGRQLSLCRVKGMMVIAK